MLSVSIYFVGVMIGVTICGMLADRFGRRKIIMVTITGQIIAGTAVAFSPNYASYVALRFLLGLFMEVSTKTTLISNSALDLWMMQNDYRQHHAN